MVGVPYALQVPPPDRTRELLERGAPRIHAASSLFEKSERRLYDLLQLVQGYPVTEIGPALPVLSAYDGERRHAILFDDPQELATLLARMTIKTHTRFAEPMREATLDSFLTPTENHRTALAHARRLASFDSDAAAGLYLHGPVGTGKTFLAVATARAWLVSLLTKILTEPARTVSSDGAHLAYVPVHADRYLESPLVALFEPGVPRSDDRRTPYALIDDVSAANRGTYTRLLGNRALDMHDRGAGLAVVTANAPPERLFAKVYKDSTFDRIMDRFRSVFRIVELGGPSGRSDASW